MLVRISFRTHLDLLARNCLFLGSDWSVVTFFNSSFTLLHCFAVRMKKIMLITSWMPVTSLK